MSNQVRFKPNKGFDANALTIINLADPINPTDAATMEWVQAQIAAGGVTALTGSANQIAVSNSTGAVTLSLAPTITGLTSITATTFTGALVGNAASATNMAGGVAGSVTYQTAAGISTMLAPTTNGYVLTLVNGLPAWAASVGGGGGSTVNVGTALVNFGTGSSDTLTVITGQTGILSTSILQCTISPAVTSNNGIDEHWVENLAVSAGNIVAGVGFTIYAKCTFGKAFGNFNIAWSWI